MSEKGIATFWECECSAKNPLRFRKCKACGRDMPDSFAHKIYYEELKAQKAFVFVENAEKSKIRCLKIGSFLEGWENAIVPIMIMLVIMLNGRRICLDSGTVYNCTYERLVERQERLLTEADNFQGTMTGLKSTPLVFGKICSDIIDRIEDASEGVVDKQEESRKYINQKKIERTKTKIEGVIEYVTNKFE